MSFGTFTLFGFYQQPNKTGILFPINLSASDKQFIANDNAKTGTVNDTNWFFSYAREAVPIEIIEGGAGAFPINLLSDSDVGVRYATAAINISGNFYNDINVANTKSVISGSFFPKDSDVSNNQIIISGLVSGVKFDNYYNLIVLSGLVSGIKFDNANIVNVVSGSINDAHADLEVLNFKISGVFSGINPDFPSVSTKISGKFFPVKNDYAKIDYLLTGWSAGENYGYTGINLQDDINNITYFLSSYASSNK